MKRFVIFLSFLLVLIPSVAGIALAVSPMPEEIEKDVERKSFEKVKQGETDIVCKVRIIYKNDATSGKPSREDFSHSVVMEGLITKKDTLEKTLRLIEDKLKEEDISEVKIECKFPKLKSKEQ